MIAGPSETVTFLFTDIEGSTALWERDPDRMRVALAEHDRLVRTTIERHGGSVFKTVGDAFCAAFADPGAALEAAIAAQHALQGGHAATSACLETDALRVRIALHIGTAEVRDGDYFGPPLNRVARMLDAAHGGQVLLSRAVHDVTHGALPPDVELRDLGEHRLRDLAQPERLYQVVTADLRDDFAPLNVVPGPGDDPASGSAGPALEIYVLGGFRVIVNGQPLPDGAWRRRKARQLFKCLATRRNFRLLREEAIELLWPESDSEAGAINLRSNVHSIRRALEAAGAPDSVAKIVTDRDTISLRSAGQVWVDADAFEDTIARAHAAHDPLPLLEQANALYTGDLLPEDVYEDWSVGRREALKQRWIELQFLIAQHAERRDDVDTAAAALLRLLGRDSSDERAGQDLMRLYVRHGRRAEAVRVYQRLVLALRDELGVDPSPETVELQRQIADGRLAGADRPPLVRSEPRFVCGYPFPAPSQLVGRQVELARLERVLERGRNGGQVVMVGAPAGTGKSTLLGALVRRAREAGTLCLAGGCYEQAGAIPLGPFQDALADYLLAQPADRVRADLGSAAADLALVIPELRHRLDLADAPTQERSAERMRLFGAVHACLRTLAERGPVLICLEDLHAADTATLQLLHYLGRQTKRLPLLLVATFRTEQAAPGQPLGQLMTALARERLVEELGLEPLDRADTARLVASLLEGPASEQLNASLYASTEGNPLFVEQLVLALQEDGRVDWRGGVWDQVGDPARRVPTIVREVVAQRFDRLSASCRSTLALAAVFGQTVEHRSLRAAAEEADEAALMADLEEALEAHLLDETPSGYAFHHALLRETVYWSLAAPRRMLLHRRAAEALERVAGRRATDLSAELSRHYALAGDAPDVRAKALEYSLEAGRRASAVSGYREALEHFRRACDLLEREGDGAERDLLAVALGGRAYAEQQLAMWEPAIASFRRLLRLADDPVRRASAHSAIAFALQQIGATATALEEADEGLAGLEDGEDRGNAAFARLRLQFQKALLWFLQGQFRNLVELGREMERAALELDRPRALFWAHSALAMADNGRGLVEPAIEQYQLALAAAERADDKIQMATGHSNLGIQYYRGGQLDAARAHLDRALTLYRDSASELRAVMTVQMLGRLALAEGQVDRAAELADLGLSLATEAKDRWEAECHDLLGAIHMLRADWQDAEVSFTRALAIRERVGHAAGTSDSLIGLGLVFERRGDLRGAQPYYARAVEIARVMDPSPQRVAAERHLGRLLLRLGDERGAAYVSCAFALAETMPRSMEYAPTVLAMAGLRWREGDLESALNFAETSHKAARTAELTIAARLALADLHRAADRLDAAHEHAAHAARLAEELRAPYLQELARRAVEAMTAADSCPPPSDRPVLTVAM